MCTAMCLISSGVTNCRNDTDLLGLNLFTVSIQAVVGHTLRIQSCPVLLQVPALLLDDAQQLCNLLCLQATNSLLKSHQAKTR